MKKVLCFLFIILLTLSGCDSKKNISKSKAFFMKIDNSYYLYGLDGKKVNDLGFDKVSDFNGKYAIVVKDNKYGVINDEGKITINFGEYDEIIPILNVFRVSKDGKSLLIAGDESLIKDLDNIEGSYNKNMPWIIQLKDTKNKKMDFKDNFGNHLLTINYNEDSVTFEKKENYIIITNGDMNYLIDYDKSKKILDFKNDREFCIDSVSTDKTKVLLKTCKNNFSGSNTEYRLVENEKLFNTNNECNTIKLDGNVALCTTLNDKYIMSGNSKVVSVIKNMTYSDNSGYAKNSEKSGVDFYKSNKLVKHVDCASIVNPGRRDGIIVLTTTNDSGCNTDIHYVLYDENGNKLKDFDTQKISNIDINGNYLVEKDNKYYLINIKGEKTTDEYERIESYDGYYVVTNNYLRGILDNNGNIIIDVKYDTIDLLNVNDKEYALLSIIDGKNILYNITNRKQIYFSNNKIVNEKNYFYVNYYGSKYYYSYINGKMFYKEEL